MTFDAKSELSYTHAAGEHTLFHFRGLTLSLSLQEEKASLQGAF